MEILKTNNYALFSSVDGNRSVSKTNSLVKSIKEIDLTMYKPILVDDGYRIIDGQHRFFACKQLSLPIYFMVVRDKDIKKALVKLNAVQKMWRQEDYLNFFDSNVGGAYSDLKKFMEEKKMKISNAMVVLPKGQINAEYIKSGSLNIELNEKANDIADFLNSQEISQLKFSGSRQFVLAIRKAFELFSQRQLNKLKRNSLKIPHCANFSQYMTVFENIIKP